MKLSIASAVLASIYFSSSSQGFTVSSSSKQKTLIGKAFIPSSQILSQRGGSSSFNSPSLHMSDVATQDPPIAKGETFE